MKLLILDIGTDYISFEKQATKTDGTKINPTVATVRIFEEEGDDANYGNVEVSGSPFTCNIINGKVGNYGALVSKALFAVGRMYRALFEWTVDGIDTASVEIYSAINASQLKATGFSTHNAAAIWAAANRELSTPANYKANVSPLALEATLTAMKGAGWSTETLKAIQDAITAVSIENFTVSDGID